MKFKAFFYSLLALSLFALYSCNGNDDDLVDEYTGSYNIVITPNFNLTYPGFGSYNLTANSSIKTTGVITDDDNNNITIKIEGVNGYIDDITITAFCDTFSMRLNDSSYDGYIRFDANNNIYCDLILKGTSVSTPYNGTMSWDIPVSGTCEADIFGLGQSTQCDVSGKISFVATKK